MSTVIFTRRGYQYSIRFAYDPTLVETIKSVVPSYARTWDRATKQWTVEPVYASELAEAIQSLGHDVHGINTSRQREHCDRNEVTRWAHLLFKRVGPDRAPVAYRLLSKLCHPDHGGDHQLQVELNNAYAELPTQKRTA